MNYKIFIIFIFIVSCTNIEVSKKIEFNQKFSNAGFTLIYDEDLYKNKIVSKKIDNRSLIIFQKNLKPKTNVKITNVINDKSLIAVVGSKSKYPSFYNSVISNRIAKELQINPNEPYIRVVAINKNDTFLANKSKTFAEEREVAVKAPVEEIGIKDLSKKKKIKIKEKNIQNFEYVIKIADFYYLETAKLLKKRILNELGVKSKIIQLSKTNFRVYLGPYDNFKNLKYSFDQIKDLNFENIEVIKL